MMDGDEATWTNGLVPVVKPEHLATLLASTSDLAFIVSPDGRIKSILMDHRSDDHARLSHWTDHPMENFLTIESVPKFENALATVLEAGTLNRLVELNHADGDAWQHPVRYSFHTVGPDGHVLMLGKDLRLVAEAQEQLVQAQIALERGYEERREHDARYRILMANTRDAFVFVASDGRIRDLNAAAARLLESDLDRLIGAPIAKEFRNRRRGEFIDTLMASATSEGDKDLTVQTARGQRDLILSPSVFRAAGEKLILCRLVQASAAQPGDDVLRKDLDLLFQKTSDAIVLTDMHGVIVEANEAFLELTDLTNLSDATTRSLGDFLQRGQVDLNVMLENTQRAGTMRIYSTRIAKEAASGAGVEISSVFLNDGERPLMGFILRDADRAMAIRSTSQPANTNEAPNHNVVELVGSATLKEIVAETSDVIEKMCIETAVELTRNNRAAAAEMLGVSRQSLYVKLRKYGLLKRDDD